MFKKKCKDSKKTKNKMRSYYNKQVENLGGGASYLPQSSIGGFLWPTGSNPHSTIFENSPGDPME